MIPELVFMFLLGGAIGSFMNVVIYRSPLERSIVAPGSACDSCGTPLKWWHNLPVLSYLMLRGRCHYCGTRYTGRYAMLELFTASVAAGLFWFYGGWSWQLWHAFALFFFACTVFFTDLDHWIIPDSVSYWGIFTGIVLTWNLPLSLSGIALGYAFFKGLQVLGTRMARQDALGGGDVKFAMVIGAFLGWHMGLIALLASFALGALIALPLALVRGNQPVPFGTFMALAALAVELRGSFF